MFHFIDRMKAFVPHINLHVQTQEEADLAYLNDAVDIYDVERRMAEIDHRAQQPSWQLPGAIFKLH